MSEFGYPCICVLLYVRIAGLFMTNKLVYRPDHTRLVSGGANFTACAVPVWNACSGIPHRSSWSLPKSRRVFDQLARGFCGGKLRVLLYYQTQSTTCFEIERIITSGELVWSRKVIRVLCGESTNSFGTDVLTNFICKHNMSLPT